MRRFLRTATERAFSPVDPASLGFFRLAFGAILLWEVFRFFTAGWIYKYYVEPEFHFTYLGFAWVRPWPAYGMQIHFVVLGMAAAFLALGLWCRLAAWTFFLGFGYVFLLEKARYLNHFYLIILLGLILTVIPAQRAFALDARRQTRPLAAPAWSLFLVRTQVGLVYLFAGLGKLNPDWLRAEPLRDWLGARADIPFLGSFLGLEATAWLFSYGGLLLDLLAWPLLSARATRWPTFLVTTSFHLTNASVFGIGIFPWVMIAATTVFFPPDWPRRILRSAHRTRFLPACGALRRRVVLTGLGLYLALQLLLPLRHFLYPGRVDWTEEGHCFSWHMKLRSKRSKAIFMVRSSDGDAQWLIDPRAELLPWQVSKMSDRPDMILQYAHHLAERKRGEGHAEVQVYAHVQTSLNGRRPQPLIDPGIDLAARTRNLAAADWILPLEEPLRRSEPPD